MAKAYASAIIDAPVERVWAAIRDFGALASWHPALDRSEIEGGGDPDVVGCIRKLELKGGAVARERLLMLDDSRYTFAYNFETPAFPIDNYVATVELIPVTNGDRTFAQWTGMFDPRPDEEGDFVDVISNAVFASGWTALAERLAGAAAPEGADRWQGLRPAKVFCSSVIPASAARVWAVVRDFAGMGEWHPDITGMHMLGGARPDKVSGTRHFSFGDGVIEEQLTFLSDPDRAFRYRILASGNAWLNYHAALRLYDVTAGDHCLAVWTADWLASPQDDLTLIPFVHDGVFQRAFDTVGEKLAAG
ncbi:MAG: SRPBCC family protein [Proteobacteria bacterium]|nr:SRPBCC family protein [Pseudomonadota bacterium]